MSKQRYSPEFKDEAVRQIVDRGYSVAEVLERRRAQVAVQVLHGGAPAPARARIPGSNSRFAPSPRAGAPPPPRARRFNRTHVSLHRPGRAPRRPASWFR